jgi:hypothetical protein
MRPAIAACALALALGGCHGCRDEHPYVPYAVGGEDAAAAAFDDASAPVAAPSGGDAGAAFAGEVAAAAPPGLTRWSLQGVTLEAPPATVFVSAVVRDFDGDGASDAFAIVRPAEGNDPGQLVYYHGPARGDALVQAAAFTPPPELARDATCAPVDRLVLVGRAAVLTEIGAQCPAHPTRAPDRWVAVVAASGGTARTRLAVTASDPPGAAALTVDADASDRDGDGRDDVALRVAIEGGGAPLEPGPRVSATFAWLDRPAGLSPDGAATTSSFAALAGSATSRAARAKDAPAVPGLVAQERALWRAVCAEGGAPRVVGVAGAGTLPCAAARPLEDAGLAEVRAYTTMGDPLRAALALDRAQRAPASRTASRLAEAQGWIAQLAPAASPPRTLRAVAAVPAVARGHEPSWGALAFEPGGKLLVRTRAGVVRVDPDLGDESEAPGADWKLGVTSPDGALRWIEAYDPCDGLPLRATFAPSSGDDARDVALPVPPPLGDRCAGARGAPARVLPVAWGAGGLEAIVEGEPVLVAFDLARATPLAAFLDQAPPRGAPRSPDGKAMVVATGSGLVVRGAGRSRLLRAAELDGTYAEQTDCAVANDAAHVACVRAGKAWVGAWDAP